MATERVQVLIGTPLAEELVAQIRAVDPRLEVAFRPDLLGTPRYDGDHYAPAGRDVAREAEFRALLAETEVLFDFDSTTAAQLTTLAPRLRWVQSTSAGVGQTAKRFGLDKTEVIVTTASGVHAGPLAEFVLMAMLMFTKRHGHLMELKAQRKFARFVSGALPGKTLAIIGPGKIGREIARLARPFGVRLTALARVNHPAEELGVDQVYSRKQLHTMLGEADFVVLAVPHTAETEGLLGAAEIAAMKPSAVLINIARGLIVDEDALLVALRDGHLAGAALDVFRQEPLPADSPFWDLPNVIVNSHSASTAEGENAKIVDLFCDNLRHYLAGKTAQMHNVLDKTLLY